MSDIVIEKQRPEEAEDIIRVFHKSWLATYPNEAEHISIDDIEHEYKDSYSADNILKMQERIRTGNNGTALRLTAKDDGRIVGVSTAIREEKQNKLFAMYILPECIGKGIGTKMWEEIVPFLDPTKETVVEVVDYNVPAINFYKKLGFQDTGETFQDEDGKLKSGSNFTQMRMVRPADIK